MDRIPKFDQIGYWSEIKLEIVREYAAAYSRILHAQERPRLRHLYIDAFAGAGVAVSRSKGEFVPGSPLNALLVEPPFKEYHFIDLDPRKTHFLGDLAGTRADVHTYEGDCNRLLLEKVFPRARRQDYCRALCLLDPYGLHLNWEVIQTAGGSEAVEIFLNFPVMDMNRNVLWQDSGQVTGQQSERMDAFWGDDSWRTAAYSTQGNLFGYEEKQGNEAIAHAFKERLKNAAGFRHVLEPLAMRNSRGAILYYLYFASQKPVAEKIVREIFAKHSNRGAGDGHTDNH